MASLIVLILSLIGLALALPIVLIVAFACFLVACLAEAFRPMDDKEDEDGPPEE
jgi:hypothetical protein